jgi:hypothetical protein
MKKFLKFAFSGIALATLAACGGGGNDTATPDTTTNSSTVAATSAAIFIPAGSTSKVIQFAGCNRTSNSNPLLGLSSPGGTLTIAANGDITVAYTDSGLAAVGATPAVPALNINRTFLHNTAAYSSNDFQMFVVERNNGSTRYRFSVDRNSEAIRLYASGGVTRTFENYLYFSFNVNGTNETLECGYVTNIDPAIAANIRDYNARIASFTTPLRGAYTRSSNYTTPTLDVANNTVTWREALSGVPTGSTFKYNATTGLISYQPVGATAFTDFNTNTNMASSTGRFAYQEYRESNSSVTQITSRSFSRSSDERYIFFADPVSGFGLGVY